MAARDTCRQPSEQLNKLGSTIEDVMKCALNVAEDVQEEELIEEKSQVYVEDIKQYLVEFAKLAEDVSLRQKAMEQLRANTDIPDDQEPQDLSSEFTSCLNLLKGSQKDSYDPWTHPTLEEFKELVMVAQGGDENDDEDVAMEEDSEVVVNQVTMSFKCPITKQFYVRPVTSKTCNHSYSQEAVQEHIRKSRGPMAKCPVCGVPLNLSDLVRDKKLEAMVKKAKRREARSRDNNFSAVDL